MVNLWYANEKQLVKKSMLSAVIALGIMMMTRVAILLPNYTPTLGMQHVQELKRAFTIGLLYDVRIAALLSFIVFLICSIQMTLRVSDSAVSRTFSHGSALLLSALFLISVGNFYYCQTYGRYFDTFIFGLFEEETGAVLSNIWDGYPVIRALIAVALVYTLLVWVQNRCFRLWSLRNPPYGSRRLSSLRMTLACVVTLAVFFVAMRGSVGTFPLRRDYAQVSDIKQLNMITPNAAFALQWAIKDHADMLKVPTVTDAQGAALWQQLTGQKVAHFSLKTLESHTPTNPFIAQHKPNVVMSVMESMGSHFLEYDDGDRDMLGALRAHWQQDFVFRRFLPEGNGTMDSLARFFIRSPLMTVDLEQVSRYSFLGNGFTPFKKNGYKVVFATSGNMAWRNLSAILPKLGVDELVDQNTLMKLYPDAQPDTWGVPDQYLFDYIQKRLAKADQEEQPVFIMSMSTTNHPPYQVPPHYQPRDLHITPAMDSRFAHLGNVREVFGTYTYANDVLGHFLTDLKHSTGADHTIVAITGDHNIRGIGYPDPQEIAIGHAVPLYLYVPTAYQQNIAFDPNRIGSHKDILPTLYSLALSDTAYLHMGCNILAKDPDPVMCNLGYNAEASMTPQGHYGLTGPTISYQPWSPSATPVNLAASADVSVAHDADAKRIDAYRKLLDWQLYRQMQK